METKDSPGPAISTVTPTKYSHPHNPPQSSLRTFVVSLALRGFAYVIGLQVVSFFYARAFYDSYKSKPPSASFWAKVEEERSNLWSLKLEDNKVKGIDGFFHAFEDVVVEAESIRTHYITNSPIAKSSIEQSKDLIVLLHGWPDNCMVWRNVLTLLNDDSVTLIVPDIAGHGGSQNLPNYSPSSVLPVIFNFILSMRRQHLSSDHTNGKTKPKLILVGHDWGAAVSARIAAECPELIDHVILTNGPIVNHALSRSKQNLDLASAHLRDLNLMKAWRTARPSLIQMFLRSSYIWAYDLPMPFIRPLGTAGNMWFLRLIARAANGQTDNGESESVIKSLAEILGPNTSAANSGSYHNSVGSRAANPNGRFFESIKLYRDGLASGLWEQSSEIKDARALLKNTSSSLGNRKADTLTSSRPPGALEVPLTMLWCLGDVALDYHICVDGIEDYMYEDSIAVKFKGNKGRKIGHWVPVTASDELTRAVQWVANGKQGDLVKTLGSNINVVDTIKR